MRRTDREITDLSEIEAFLKQARFLHLGLVDGAAPYVVPLHYGYRMDGGRLTLYMHSAPEGRKLDLIRANSQAFVEIDVGETPISGGDVPCKYGAAYASVMGAGIASLVSDPQEKIAGLQLLMRHQTGRDFVITEQMAETVQVIRVVVETLTAKCRPMPM